MFKTWEAEKQGNNKLDFRFETKESRSLCENFIKQFKLKSLKGYNDISSLTNARWAITHEFSKERGYPLWSLKYESHLFGTTTPLPDGFKTLIDNILKICDPSFDTRNPLLINDTLNGIEKYEFELGNFLNSPDSFKTGFNKYLKSIEVVNIQDNEVEEAIDFLTKHLEETVGLWTETEVYDKLKDWRMNKDNEEKKRREEEELKKQEEEELRKKEEERQNANPTNGTPPVIYSQKRTSAINKIKQISSVNQAQKLLEKICETGNEAIFDIINNYDV
jgi:hypothetical protein